MDLVLDQWLEDSGLRRRSRCRTDIEVWLLMQQFNPAESELLITEIDAHQRLLILVPTQVAEDVRRSGCAPLAELRALYPFLEITLP